MRDFSRAEAALRVGVELETLDRLIEVGAVVPGTGDRFSEGGIRKIGLVATLRAAGVPDETIAAEIRTGRLSLDFFDNPSFGMFSALSGVTFERLAAERNLPLQLVLAIREAIGSAIAQPADRVREIELEIVPVIEARLASGYSSDSAERLLRTLGDSLRRYVLAEADVFRHHVIRPLAGAPGQEISQAAEAAVERMSGHVEAAMLAMYHAQRANAWTANLIEGVEAQLAEAGALDSLKRPPAMCFLDITGYTRLTAERGDKAAADLADALGRLVQRASVEHGGRPVKWLGDGVMFYFPAPGPGVVAALKMAEGIAQAGLPPAHVGLHAGPVLFQDGDYYGQTVNIASRIAEYARPGEVLVSRAVVDASSETGIEFAGIGAVELKGVAGPVDVYAARRG